MHSRNPIPQKAVTTVIASPRETEELTFIVDGIIKRVAIKGIDDEECKEKVELLVYGDFFSRTWPISKKE